MAMERVKVVAPKGIPSGMVVQFIDKCRAGLPALQTALAAAEFEILRVSGHRLKGTGAAYGFPPLTVIGASIEQAARGRDAGELQSRIAELEDYLGSVEVVV
jgi:HPt (histidine-containing phosphotransfer) domain-containing protein